MKSPIPMEKLGLAIFSGLTNRNRIRSCTQGVRLFFRLKQTHLHVQPAFLFGFVDLIFRAKMSQKKRGARIVMFHVGNDSISIIVGVTVSA